jgi:cobalt-zinc-cadmium efflux system outer membrane protein
VLRRASEAKRATEVLYNMLFSLLLAFTVAQDTTPRALLLGDVYREARAASPRAIAARELANAARARVPSAKLPPDPELQLGWMNYALPQLAPMEPIGMTQLQLMQMLPLAGKLRLSGRVASSQANAAADRARDVEWEVRAQAAMAFYELYATDRALAVARETLRLLQDVLRIAEAMYRVGEGRQADVLRAQVEIARMVEDTIRMTTMRAGMSARLNALIDKPADSPVFAPVLPAFPDSTPALAALTTESQSSRPMVQAAQRDVEAATAQASLARREIWPDLTVGIQYGQRGSTMGTERMGSLMLGASLPVFANQRQLRMRQEAAAMRRMADAELAAMRAATRGSVAEAYAGLVRARNLAALYRTTVIPQAEATVASALAAYRVGSVDFMTLLDDRMTVNKYRQELYALESEQGKAWAELEMLLGRQLLDADARSQERQ